MRIEAFRKLSDLEEQEALKRMVKVPRHYYRITLPTIKLPSIVHSAKVELPPLVEHSEPNGSSSFRFLGIVEFAEQTYGKKKELTKDYFEEYVLSRKEYAEKLELVQRLLGYKPMWLHDTE